MKLIRLDEETGTRIKRSVPKQANVMKRHGSRELALFSLLVKRVARIKPSATKQ